MRIPFPPFQHFPKGRDFHNCRLVDGVHSEEQVPPQNDGKKQGNGRYQPVIENRRSHRYWLHLRRQRPERHAEEATKDYDAQDSVRPSLVRNTERFFN